MLQAIPSMQMPRDKPQAQMPKAKVQKTKVPMPKTNIRH
jgi:hypothetical protein